MRDFFRGRWSIFAALPSVQNGRDMTYAQAFRAFPPSSTWNNSTPFKSVPNAVPSAAFDNLLVAIHTVSRRRLDAIVPLVYQAHLQGQIDEAATERLQDAAQLRRETFAARVRVHNHKKAMGPRPERPQHPRSRWRDNRRVWSGSGPLPPSLRHHFTAGENAVAAIIRAEVRKHGVCKLPYAAIAKSAGLLSTTVVKRFVRIAKAKGLIAVQERKVAHNRNAPNVITIISAEWKSWNEGGKSKGGGGISVPPIQNKDIKGRLEKPQSLATARLGGSETTGAGSRDEGNGRNTLTPSTLRRQFSGQTPNNPAYPRY
ncbi:hypothetical protein [Agrobacterium tumefaciens]|uniref:hypothetical protein n=1 Tax=Agrobacterium tumefaciens TaxID=358 RepID=UPI001574CD87|nr:hypothetical protein [Agrobacterium tumefaciens]